MTHVLSLPLIVLLGLGLIPLGACSGPDKAPSGERSGPKESSSVDRPPLVGPTWRVTMLVGTDVQGESAPTMQFDESGTVHGTTGCNRYRAPYRRTGDELTVGMITSTKRGCPGPIMEQERRFLTVFQEATEARIDADGRLHVHTAADSSLTAVALSNETNASEEE